MKWLLPLVIVFCPTILLSQAKRAFTDYEQPVPGSSLRIKLVAVQGGNFSMGSPEKEKDRKKNEGPRQVFTVSPFWMGAYEITHDLFSVFYNDVTTSQNSSADAVTRPSAQYVDLSWGMGKDGGYPVNSMQQKTALMYCRWLYQKTGIFFRLPTMAEWEYACRAGSESAYFFGDNPDSLKLYAWYGRNSNNVYHKVGQLKPNKWGLYDMLGNVAEWVLDQYDENYFVRMKEARKDPLLVPSSKNPRLLKGGGYTDEAADLRCAAIKPSLPEWNRRDPQVPKSSWWLTDAPFAGFRIVRPSVQPTAEEAENFYKLYLGF